MGFGVSNKQVHRLRILGGRLQTESIQVISALKPKPNQRAFVAKRVPESREV